MNNINTKLLEISKKCKEQENGLEQLYITRNNGKQVCFFSKGCQFSEKGFCIMCNYGKGISLITKNKLKIALDEIFHNYSKNEKIPMMLFGTNGSIFDTHEMPEDCFDLLLDYISQYNIEQIYFETFYTTITKKILSKIKQKLKKSNIYIELGFESSSPNIREKALLKFINNDIFTEKIRLIHSFGFFVTTNVMLGIPFLNEKESLDSALQSINFLTQTVNVDEIVIFPLNIKKNTLLEKIEQQPIHLISILELIKNLNDNVIDKILFSWYDTTHDNPIIKHPPISCPKCYNYIVNLVNTFIKSNKQERISIRDNIHNLDCQCEKAYYKSLQTHTHTSLDERIINKIKNIKI